jgi:uncharacterized protein (DUF58 family)
MAETPRRRTFQLVARRWATGVAYGPRQGRRRGQGAEIAGSRSYLPHDHLAWIDWKTSARLSLARNEDVFVVRQYFEEIAPRIVIVVDRSPSMALYPPELPWLSKPAVAREAVAAIVSSGNATRALVGYLDLEAGPGTRDARAHWVKPDAHGGRQINQRMRHLFAAPGGAAEPAVEHLLRLRRDVPTGTFVFVLSDFLRPLRRATWALARTRGWDVVPVIIQDPVWERSFPRIGGVVLPLTDPATGRTRLARVTSAEADARRIANEERLRGLVASFQRLGFDPVLLGTAEPAAVDLAFINWATSRKRTRGRMDR